MYKRKNSKLKHFDFYIADVICIFLAFFISGMLRFDGSFRDNFFDDYFQYVLVIELIYLFYAQVFSAYKNILKRGLWAGFWKFLSVFFMSSMTFGAFLFMSKRANSFSRLFFIFYFSIAVVLILIVRVCMKAILKKVISNSKNLPKLLIVATEAGARTFLEQTGELSFVNYDYVGVVVIDHDMTGETIEGVEVVADINSMESYAVEHAIDEVIIMTFNFAEEKAIGMIFLNMGVTVHLACGLNGRRENLPNTEYDTINDFACITSSNANASPFMLGLKRALDIVGGLAGVLITGIIYLFVAPKIKKADPGPVFFKQKRVGRNGRIFEIYKFRPYT